MSPHDLRRTAAGILHRSRDDDGAHYFDLLDIQKVLGHADPATTMRSYLDPLDTRRVRAATVPRLNLLRRRPVSLGACRRRPPPASLPPAPSPNPETDACGLGRGDR